LGQTVVFHGSIVVSLPCAAYYWATLIEAEIVYEILDKDELIKVLVFLEKKKKKPTSNNKKPVESK
jgi:hypothetical protein